MRSVLIKWNWPLLLSLGLWAILPLSPSIVVSDVSAAGVYSPERGDPERKAILDGLRGSRDVIFVVQSMRVRDGWAWVHVQPMTRDHTQRYEDESALVRRGNHVWELAELRCNEESCWDDEAYFAGLRGRFPDAPLEIFPVPTIGSPNSGKKALRFAIGSGTAELGVERPQEASPEGPMAFDVAPSGEIYFLDQLNSRVQVFAADGSHLYSIPGITLFFRDLDLSPSGDLVMLEPYRQQSVVVIDQSGTERRRIALKGKGISKPGYAVAVHAREDGIWVDVSDKEVGGLWVRIAEANGTPVGRRRVDKGEVSTNGTYSYRAKVIGDITLHFERRGLTSETRGKKSIPMYFEEQLLGANLFGFDARGHLYLHIRLGRGREHPAQEWLIVLDQDGKERSRLELPLTTHVEDINRQFRVMPDGTV